jgi:hypothetical protein
VTVKQLDYIAQVSFEESGDPLNLHLKYILKSFNMATTRSLEV